MRGPQIYTLIGALFDFFLSRYHKLFIHLFITDGVGVLQTLPFRTGRVTCKNPSRPPSNERLPHGGITDTIPVLRAMFGLSTTEAVALIGRFGV